MKTIAWTAYGPPDVLQLREVEKPTPKAGEVLIRIYATTVSSGDCEMRSLSGALWHALALRAYVGLTKPQRITVLGMEMAGEIEATGTNVKRFREGDQVFGATGLLSMGTYAEYICLPEVPEEGALAAKPVNMTYEEAAAVPVGGIEALQFLRQGNIQSGQRVLINGAAGTIGPYAVQLARFFGAEVTAIDSTEKLDMLRAIGADHVIDYTKENFTRSGETYDFILDVVSKSPFSASVRSLKPDGCYLIANPGLSQWARGRWVSMTSNKSVIFGAVSPKAADLIFLKELIEASKLKAVIDRSYPLEQAAEAHRYVETGHKTGNVVMTMAQSDNHEQIASKETSLGTRY